MSILIPGPRSARFDRRSQLAFSWSARDADLAARTGQPYALTQQGALPLTGGNVVPAVGTTVVAGKAMPRFGRDATLGLNYLELAGNVAGQDVERLVYFAVFPARDLSVVVRFTGLWTAGANLATPGGLLSIGLDQTQNAGVIRVWRSGTVYNFARATGATSLAATQVENAALVWPADLLITWNNTTAVLSFTIRGANGTTFGTSTVTATALISTKRFGGEGFALGSDVAGAVAGAPLRLYLAKVASGVKTFAQMDALV